MAIDDRELDQRLKDQLRMIEMGETLEDLNDPEEYEDEGGIRSLRKAPSIKMASETPEEEFELELGGMLEEFKDAVKNGYKGTIEDYSKEYFGKKEKAPSIKLASGYKLNDFELNKSVYDSFGVKLYNLIDDPEMGNFREDEVREMIYGGQYAMGGRVNYNQGTPKQEIVKPSKSMMMDTTTYPLGQDPQFDDKLIYRPDPKDSKELKRLKELMERRKKEKVKRAMGGIAGVL